jgi:alpha-tubulin suppressor-like RCC1 family protein
VKLSRVFVGLAIIALVAFVGWRMAKRPISASALPVEIRCDRFVTQPQVVSGGAVLILAPDGTVWGWGENKAGAMENKGGLLAPVNVRGQWHVPRRLEVGSNWVALAAGYTDAIGIKTDGSLWGWSFALAGHIYRFGPCTIPPAQLAPGTNWAAVAAAAGHALALRGDGTLWAFGGNEHGQLGDGKGVRHSPTRRVPVTPLAQVGTNQNWIAIAAACYSSLGLQSGGSLWRWGQIQVAPEINLSQPTRVDAETNWAAISAGDFCFIGRKRDNSLWAWGANARALGCTSETNPCLVSAQTNWSTVAGGGGLLVALQQSGTLWQCGLAYSEHGGLNRLNETSVPALIEQRDDWVNAWAMSWMSFGLTKDGTLWTWGFRPDNQREGSKALEKVSIWLLQHHVRSPMYLRHAVGSETPWPLVRFVTNAPPATR